MKLNMILTDDETFFSWRVMPTRYFSHLKYFDREPLGSERKSLLDYIQRLGHETCSK